jgi:hypothetical protein
LLIEKCWSIIKALNCENGLLGIAVDFVDNLIYAKLGETLPKVLYKNKV